MVKSGNKMSSGLKALLNANPEMKLKDTYKNEMPGESMTSVYLVEEAGQEKVVKIASKAKDNKFLRGAQDQIIRESKVLQELNGFYNSPKHLGFYDLDNHVAIAREKLDFEYIDNWRGTGRDKYEAIKTMMEAYHEKGVSGLDFDISRNIAILDYASNNLTLFDFGKSSLRSENPSEYEAYAKNDKEDLFRMFSK